MSFDYDPRERWLPQTDVHGLDEMDAEADRVRAELDWSLAAFVGIFDADFEWVLFVQLGDYASARYDGRPWVLPGGAVQPNELPSNAAIREVEEETGIKLDKGSLLSAGWFGRPYYKPHWRERMGELLLLYAAIADPDSLKLRPSPPEIENLSFFPFDVEALSHVPDRGVGTHPLQPLPKHWNWWARAAQRALEHQMESPIIWEYSSAEDLALPPWATVPLPAPQTEQVDTHDISSKRT